MRSFRSKQDVTICRETTRIKQKPLVFEDTDFSRSINEQKKMEFGLERCLQCHLGRSAICSANKRVFESHYGFVVVFSATILNGILPIPSF